MSFITLSIKQAEAKCMRGRWFQSKVSPLRLCGLLSISPKSEPSAEGKYFIDNQCSHHICAMVSSAFWSQRWRCWNDDEVARASAWLEQQVGSAFTVYPRKQDLNFLLSSGYSWLTESLQQRNNFDKWMMTAFAMRFVRNIFFFGNRGVVRAQIHHAWVSLGMVIVITPCMTLLTGEEWLVCRGVRHSVNWFNLLWKLFLHHTIHDIWLLQVVIPFYGIFIWSSRWRMHRSALSGDHPEFIYNAWFTHTTFIAVNTAKKIVRHSMFLCPRNTKQRIP